MKEFIIKNWTTITSLIFGPLLTWFYIKKPLQKKDLKAKDIAINASEVSVVGQNLDIYQRMLDDMDSRNEIKFQKLYKEIDELEKENKLLKERIKKLENEKTNK